jgi:hypothetical protein
VSIVPKMMELLGHRMKDVRGTGGGTAPPLP